MAKKRKKKSKWGSFFKGVYLTIKFIFSIPFYVISWVIKFFNKTKKKSIEIKINKERSSKLPKYSKFEIVDVASGDFSNFEKNLIKKDSGIGIVLGARGSGKSAVGIKILENLYFLTKNKRNFFAIGFIKAEMPSWINVVDTIDKIKNNSYVLIDEGGILFSSRKSMSPANKLLSELILIARHKNISIIFISQNSSNLDINILRQADYLILKPSSLLQKDFERKIIKELYTKIGKEFKKYKDKKGISYIHSDDFEGFVENPLPSFWTTSLSKSFEK